MRIIGLWNGDHLKGIGSYATMSNSVMIPYGNEKAFSSILTPLTALQQSVVRAINGTPRYGVNLKPSSADNAELLIYLTFPSINALAGFKEAGVKKHYIGVRVFINNIASGGYLLHYGTSSTMSYTPSNGQEYFIEIVTDLVASTRLLYVNGSVYHNSTSLPELAGDIHVGNYSSTLNKLLTTTSHNFDLMDIYVAVAETDEDAAVPRLGKMHIKTATLSSVTNDAKFTPVSTNDATIPKILSFYRDAAGSTGTYVLTDSGQSKMALHWDKPTDGTEVLGAMLQVATMKPASAQAKTVVSMGDVKVEPTMYADTATWLAYQPASIPTPEGGWSEDAIANLDIKIGSERTL